MDQHAALRERLKERHAHIQNRLSRIDQDVRHVEKPLDDDFEEQAVERENEEVLVALGQTIRTELAQIERTLARLDQGEYGVCEICGDQISAKRLEALPYAARCVTCEEKNPS